MNWAKKAFQGVTARATANKSARQEQRELIAKTKAVVKDINEAIGGINDITRNMALSCNCHPRR